MLRLVRPLFLANFGSGFLMAWSQSLHLSLRSLICCGFAWSIPIPIFCIPTLVNPFAPLIIVEISLQVLHAM